MTDRLAALEGAQLNAGAGSNGHGKGSAGFHVKHELEYLFCRSKNTRGAEDIASTLEAMLIKYDCGTTTFKALN